MIIGIKFQKIFPEHVHTMSNGLTLFKSQLKPTSPGALACIGGPVEALQYLCEKAGRKSTMTYLSYLVQDLRNFKSRVDFFPSVACFVDGDIPDIGK